MGASGVRSVVRRERTRGHRGHRYRGPDRPGQDRNGPWIADRLLELGVELAHITICGDRRTTSRRSCGSWPTRVSTSSYQRRPRSDRRRHDGGPWPFCGRELVLDADLEAKIADIVPRLMAGYPDVTPKRCAPPIANRRWFRRARTPRPGGHRARRRRPGKPTVVVLPGPPRELQPMWPPRCRRPLSRRRSRAARVPAGDGPDVRAARVRPGRHAPRRRAARRRLERLEITTCLRRGEMEMVTRYEPDAADIRRT